MYTYKMKHKWLLILFFGVPIFISSVIIIYLIVLAVLGASGRLQPKETFTPVTNDYILFQQGHTPGNKTIKFELVHDQSKQRSLNDDFIATKDTHVVVTLVYVPGIDAPATTVVNKDFTDVSGLPFEFEIAGDLQKGLDLPDGGISGPHYSLYVKVFKGPGYNSYVGDLVNEESNFVSQDDVLDTVVIQVTGLEHCDSINAGGFCTEKVRT